MKKSQKKHIKFTAQEDELLKELVQEEGPYKWNKIASKMPGRTAKQCRDRFQNYLNPALLNDKWTQKEDQLLFQKIQEYGKKWKFISQFFPTRSHNNVKNRYNSRKFMKSNEGENSEKPKHSDQQPKRVENDSTLEENIFELFDNSQLFDIDFDILQVNDLL